MEKTAPILKSHPSRLYVEVATACNLKCPMCVKQSEPGIPDDLMKEETFEKLEEVFPHLERLILNGIGEPLVHPGLEAFAARARRRLSGEAVMGFQTNGLLLSEERALSLLKAGIDVVSLSVDAADPALFRSMRRGGEAEDVNRAAEALEAAKAKTGRGEFRWGAELVLARETLGELPAVIRWVAERGGAFLIVTHIMPYSPEAQPSVVYDPNVDETLDRYLKRREKAAAEGVDLEQYYTAKWRLGPVERREEIINTMEAVVEEISAAGLPQHIPNLLAFSDEQQRSLEDLFGESLALARSLGVDLKLPAATPKADRRCDFVEDGSAFISVWGTVHPCYFLWHSYTSHADGRTRPVKALSFGSVLERPLSQIWNDPEFVEYRKEVLRYEFPYCGNCSLSPCDYIEREDFEQDCLGNHLYCGSCPWALGVIQCMR